MDTHLPHRRSAPENHPALPGPGERRCRSHAKPGSPWKPRKRHAKRPRAKRPLSRDPRRDGRARRHPHRPRPARAIADPDADPGRPRLARPRERDQAPLLLGARPRPGEDPPTIRDRAQLHDERRPREATLCDRRPRRPLAAWARRSSLRGRPGRRPNRAGAPRRRRGRGSGRRASGRRCGRGGRGRRVGFRGRRGRGRGCLCRGDQVPEPGGAKGRLGVDQEHPARSRARARDEEILGLLARERGRVGAKGRKHRAHLRRRHRCARVVVEARVRGARDVHVTALDRDATRVRLSVVPGRGRRPLRGDGQVVVRG